MLHKIETKNQEKSSSTKGLTQDNVERVNACVELMMIVNVWWFYHVVVNGQLLPPIIVNIISVENNKITVVGMRGIFFNQLSILWS